MYLTKFGRAATFAIAVLAAAMPAVSMAADYPDRAITLIVAAPVGGGTDTIARLIGQQLETQLDQPVIVENRPGGAGVVAADYLSRQPADGYTLMVTFDGHAIGGASNQSLSYDPVEDFTMISQLTSSGILITVLPDHPADDVESFLDWAKSYEGYLNIGVPGATSPGAIAAKTFVNKTGLDAEVINNQGSSKTLLGVLGGEYQVAFTSLGSTLPQVKEGTLRALGISIRKPSPLLPDVEPISQTIPGFVFESWYGLMAPAGIPDDVRDRLAEEANKAVFSEHLTKPFENAGATPIGSTPGEFKAMIEADIARWKEIL